MASGRQGASRRPAERPQPHHPYRRCQRNSGIWEIRRHVAPPDAAESNMIDDPMAALQSARPSWMRGGGLRGIVNVGWPTVRGNLVSGWRDKYVIRRPTPFIATVDNRQPAPPTPPMCPPTDHQLQFIVSGIVACPGAVGTPPNSTFILTYDSGSNSWIYSDANYLMAYSCNPAPPGSQQFAIQDASASFQWFENLPPSSPGNMTFENGLVGCGGFTDYGNLGTATWSIL